MRHDKDGWECGVRTAVWVRRMRDAGRSLLDLRSQRDTQRCD
jgi:hypothetical protein